MSFVCIVDHAAVYVIGLSIEVKSCEPGFFIERSYVGGIRRATGTLSRDIMDRYLDGVGGTPKGHRKSARPTSSAYFDLEKGEFRCFLWENFIGQEEGYGL